MFLLRRESQKGPKLSDLLSDDRALPIATYSITAHPYSIITHKRTCNGCGQMKSCSVLCDYWNSGLVAICEDCVSWIVDPEVLYLPNRLGEFDWDASRIEKQERFRFVCSGGVAVKP